MNNVVLIARIGKDIDLRYLQNGTPVASFTIAIDQSYKDKNGQKVDKTSWIDIVAFRGAEAINQYFSKGSRIGIQGELEQQTWTDNQGQKKSKIVVKCEKFFFIDSKSQSYQPPEPKIQKETSPYQQKQTTDIPFGDISDELPF